MIMELNEPVIPLADYGVCFTNSIFALGILRYATYEMITSHSREKDMTILQSKPAVILLLPFIVYSS